MWSPCLDVCSDSVGKFWMYKNKLNRNVPADSITIETTAYALLALLCLNPEGDELAYNAALWLSQKATTTGGFPSTQVCCETVPLLPCAKLPPYSDSTLERLSTHAVLQFSLLFFLQSKQHG